MVAPQSPYPSQPSGGGAYPPGQPGWNAAEVEAGRTWAYLSYASMFLGFPAFIIPLIQRDNGFALYHARQSAGIYILTMILVAIFIVFSFVTCGFGAFAMPVIFLAWIPTIHGFVLVSRGEQREPMMLFGLGEKLFGGIKVQGRG